MAYATITQGESRTDNEYGVEVLTGVVYDAVTVELSCGFSTKLSYRWPDTAGYLNLVKDGNKFYFPITTAQSTLMLGVYMLEWVVYSGTEQKNKLQIADFLQVNRESV